MIRLVTLSGEIHSVHELMERRTGLAVNAASGDAEHTSQTINVGPLKRIGARPSMGDYIGSLWQRRYFIREESKAKAFGSIKDTALGRIWLVLEPFLNAAIYFLIFSVLLQFDRGMENFVAYLVIGVTFFGFLNKQLGGAANIISSGKNLIRAFSFPRASLVFSFTLRTIIDFLPTALATIIFIVLMPPHALPTWTWLLFPVAFVIVIPFGAGLSLMTATLTTIFSDLRFIWPLLTRFWFYGSGIFWSVDMFDHMPLAQQIMQLNPGWVFLELCRETLIYGNVPPLSLWLYFVLWSIGIFTIGFILFWSQEERFGQDVD